MLATFQGQYCDRVFPDRSGSATHLRKNGSGFKGLIVNTNIECLSEMVRIFSSKKM